jgi:hypothetical protein
VIALLLIAAMAWLIICTMLVAEDMLVERFRLDVPDNLRARRVRTQFEVFRRVASVAVFVIAGLQIALTEPIRLEDVVIANGEWGQIEEITTTYVVVRTWVYAG